MSDVEVAWVAGLLEGEGSFGFCGATTKPNAQLRITCAMTDEDTIQKLMNTVGGGNYNREGRRDPRRIERSKPLYVWSMSKRLESTELLRLIRPHMSNRRGVRIDELLQYAETHPLRYKGVEGRVPHGTVNRYKHYQCRCDSCKEAMNVYARGYRARKKLAQGAPN